MSQTLDRALTILDLVAERPRRVNEVAAALQVHPSTALRLLHTLRRHAFVHELGDHQYRLGPATFRLGFQALAGMDLRTIAKPIMEELRDITSETVHLAVLGGDEVVYVEIVPAKHPVTLQSRIGAIAPMHCTSVAKAILAYLPIDKRSRLLGSRKLTRFTPNTLVTAADLAADLAETRERGYARDDEEHQVDIHCVAAPIMVGDNQVMGSLSVSSPVSRVDRQTMLSFVTPLKRAAQKASEQFGWKNSGGVSTP